MSIETATYVNQLSSANPPAGDPVSNSADHHRLVKSVLVTTFPNLNGPVTSTPAQLNTGVLPTGAIVMWSGAGNAVPSGYGLCNGSTYAKQDGSGNITAPNLQDCFLVGAGNTYAAGATGGSLTHLHTIEGTAITVAQMPPHSHSDAGHAHTGGDYGHGHGISGGIIAGSSAIFGALNGGGEPFPFGNSGINVQQSNANIYINTGYANLQNNGGGQAHTHTCDSASSLPPYYAIAFIMKL